MSEYSSAEKAEDPSYDWEDELAKLVLDEWEKATEYSSDLDDMYEDLYLMLRGERPDRQYDWQSNVVINKVFQIVWTAIPYLSQKIFGATPIIGVRSFNAKGRWQREQILEFWHTMQVASPNHTSYFLVMVMWLLRAILNGVGINKKTWHQKLKRQTIERQVAIPMQVDQEGNDTQVEPYNAKKTVSVPIEDWPHNEIKCNKDIRWDWMLKPGESIRKGRFVTDRNLSDLDTLYASELYENLDELEPGRSVSGSKTVEDHAQVKGKDNQEVPPDSDVYTDIEIYERQGVLHVYKEKVDGKYVPCFDKDEAYGNNEVVAKQMVTTIARGGENGDVVIRHEPNPYDEIAYIDMHIYFDAERWQSTGMVEPIKDLQTALNDNINASFDEIWKNLMPPVVVDKTRLWDFDTMVFAPGQRWMQSGDPRTGILFHEPSRVTVDAWQKHGLLDSEIQLTSAVNAPLQGMGQENTATASVLNTQMSTGKLDFILKMVEMTGLIPSAQMDVRFAKKFAHALTFQKILGEPFRYSELEEMYQYIPAAASVKLEEQKQRETQEDMQLLQILGSLNNPKAASVMNELLTNIFRNRDMPEAANRLDEEFFEPQSEEGRLERLQGRISPGATSNEKAIPMSQNERGVREATFTPRGM